MLGLLQGLLGREEPGAGVSHRGVEKGPVEVVAEIVMGADVAAAPRDGVCPEEVTDPVPEAEKGGREEIPIQEVMTVGDEHLEEPGHVGAVPFAVRVGLSEADVAAQDGPGKEAVVMDRQIRPGLRSDVAAVDSPPLREGDLEGSPIDPAQTCQDEPPAEPLPGRGRRLSDGHRMDGDGFGMVGELPEEIEFGRLTVDPRHRQVGEQRMAAGASGEGSGCRAAACVPGAPRKRQGLSPRFRSMRTSSSLRMSPKVNS